MNVTEAQPVLEPLDLLILTRMLRSCTAASACKDVGRLAATHLGPGEWAAIFDAHWHRLVEAGLLGLPAGKKSGKTFGLSGAGRQRVLAFLQVAEVPGNLTWPRLQSDYLFPLAMNLQPGSGEAAKLKAASPLSLSIVSRAKSIRPRAGVTAKNVLAAVAWKLIGVESEADFSAESVIQQLAFRRTPRKMSVGQVMTALAASAVGSAKTGVADLRAAAIRQWLLPPTHDHRPIEHKAPIANDLEAFACQVIDAARQCPATSRFGDNKVFISHVWRRLNGSFATAGSDLTSFKRRLIDANRDGLLHLSRADLVEAMAPTDVEESATVYDNATFHFVRI
jgi:hypothetical protein